MTRGMTLIECLIYIALSTLLISASHASILALAAASERIQQEALLLREGMFLEGLIRDDVQENTRAIGTGNNLLHMGDVRIDRRGESLRYTVGAVELSLLAPEVEVRAFSSQTTSAAGSVRLEVHVTLVARGNSGMELVRTFRYRFYL